MVNAGLSFGAGLLIGGFSLMLAVGPVVDDRRNHWIGTADVRLGHSPSVVSAAVPLRPCRSLVMVWFIDQARLSSFALQIGLLGVPFGLMVASFGRLEDGRRIGPAFVEGSRMMMHQLLDVQQEGCGHCHEKPCEEQL